MGVFAYLSDSDIGVHFSENIFRLVGLFFRFGVPGRTSQAVEIISVCLDHTPPFRQILGKVVGGADAVSLTVGKLPLYPVRVIAQLVQERGRH